ncbi:unnamed protein product [Rotaria socialis]|uniref:Uncharacterized protein n=1 Tax=Rotaria socialis TaxID=392032 RepID=A0A817PIK6_9BILA|nr:unnamed protein product [Rotaria socialis]
MADSNINKKGNDIWSLVTLDDLVAAIASLGDRTDQLKGETWRFNAKTRPQSSLWGEVIHKLKLNHNEKMRQSLYKIWHLERHDIQDLVKKKKKVIDNNEVNEDNGDINEVNEDDGDINGIEDISVAERNNSKMHPNTSLPLAKRPITRANPDENGAQKSVITEISFAFNAVEWKNTFSHTSQEMKDGWAKIFNDKLMSSGIECTLKFKTPYIMEGKRKQRCKFFGCYAICTRVKCTRKYQIILRHQPDENSSVLFLVRVFGEENHNPAIETASRNLTGKHRFDVGKRANEIGPLRVFRELINEADENLLAAGNYTQCPTIEVLKKAASDYREKMHIDENIFQECRMIRRAYLKDDTSSTYTKGYIHEMGEVPFRTHLYSETQIERYINYVKNEKYSYVHIDATGAVLKQMCEQKQPLLYAMIFKDGTDANDTVPLAHSVLTDHTVPSLGYFFGKVAYNITEVAGKLVLPSFFIIDFSAATMNAVLQAFNIESINAHLNRCWNVVQGKYSSQELRSLSFIHLCCCHVIHAMARSLTTARTDKKIRRALLHILAFMLCSNDIEQLYDTLGQMINIFGDPNEKNAREKLEQMVSLDLNVDEESASMLKNGKKIFKQARRKKDELGLVDEYLRSNAPIIHQSPFNKEAIRRYPNLTNLINNKCKTHKIDNPLFSPSIIRILYRWWAYLPLWTGLLINFEERYSNNIKRDSSVIYNPIRYSNAIIESYFRTFKKCICKGKRRDRPAEIIMELHRGVKTQSKANEFGVTQSSKGRKRRKTKVNEEDEWGKRKGEKTDRTAYFKSIDKLASKRGRTKMDDNQADYVTNKYSDSEDTTTISSKEKSKLSSEQSDDDISSNESIQSTRSSSSSLASKTNSRVSNEYHIDIPMNLGKPTVDDDEESEASIESDLDTNTVASNTNIASPVNYEQKRTTDQSSNKPHAQFSSQPEVIINGCTIRWPKFEVNNVTFEGRLYSLRLTCPLDAPLLALYFLYKTDNKVASEFDDAPASSPYSTLVKTFQLVEKDGWDTARIYWLLAFNILKQTDCKPKNLFGSLDERVFSFLKRQQQYSTTVTCSRLDCTDKERILSTTELGIRSCDVYIENFEEEVISVCQAMMKGQHEMTEADALKNKYKYGSVPMINCETNESGYIKGWLCDAFNVQEPATFDHGYPPIIIANIPPVIRNTIEGYDIYPGRFRNMKRVIRIGHAKYRLRVLMHNKNDHFTATLIGSDDKLYIYDDHSGIREVRSSTGDIEMAIYTQIYDV